MYFLWKAKSKSVLSIEKKWIPAAELPKRFNEILAFSTVEEARKLQKTEYLHDGTSVLNRKSFLQKTKLRNMPIIKTVAVESLTPHGFGDKPLPYTEYLDRLSDTVAPNSNTAVFPPSNIKETFQTPLIHKILELLSGIQEGIVALNDEEERLRQEIRQFDLLNADRLHQVEMCPMTEEESILYVQFMRAGQIERRKRKNELAAVLLAKDALHSLDRPDIKECIRAINNLSKQEYHCRILTDDDPLLKGKK